MIKIGVSSCFLYPDPDREVFSKKTLCYLENDMAKYLTKKQVFPVLIPDVDEDVLVDFISEMDGFVFQGGADIAPESYGESPLHREKWHGDRYRDAYELRILDYAINHHKPVLGICRGFQLLNVYFGGTLIQDIETFHSDAIQHRDSDLYDQLIHTIEFTENGLLERLHPGLKEKKVNSVHHQGIKELGSKLEVLAYCEEDGMIEAFQWKGDLEGKVLGIQWHPEFFYNYDGQLISGETIYSHFLSYCKD